MSNDAATHRRNAHRPFADHVEGFGHATLADLPAYRAFREALAELIDESNAPLGQLLGDVRHAAISSPFGALCPQCRTTSWPWRGNRRGDRFIGHYHCTCGATFRAAHAITDVDWANGHTTT